MPLANKHSWHHVWRGLTVIAMLLVVGWVLQHADFQNLFDTGWVDGQPHDCGPLGVGLFVVIGAIAIACGLPPQIFCFLAGYGAGCFVGSAFGLGVTVLGSIVTFLYARLVAREVVRQRLGARASRVDEFLGYNPFVTTVLIRLLPMSSNVLTNLTAGVSAVSAPAFLSGSLIGFVPQTIVFALLGSGVRTEPMMRVGLAIVLFAVFAVLGTALHRRLRPDSATVESAS
ncbi:MAG TPA: VTT domain-containing protein [Magnetospirillaceae bacterium]|jgi:uncharacterized membrane protein YdjX (TVP38/TMEM64 family)